MKAKYVVNIDLLKLKS